MKKLIMTALVCVAFSNAFASGYSLTINPTNPFSGQTFSISFQAPSGANTWNDWVGISTEENPYEVLELWTLLGGARSGSRSFIFTTPGNYTIQYYDRFGFARSLPIHFSIRIGPEAYRVWTSTANTAVGNQISISWETANGLDIKDDIIGYARAESPTNVVRFAYVESQADTVYWNAGPPGTYNFGYYKPVGNSHVLVSPIVQVRVSGTKPSFQRLGNKTMLRWYGFSGVSYQVLTSTEVNTPLASWQMLSTVSGGNGFLSYTNTTTDPKRFFVIKEIWP